ncbi:hypothetical protein, partial [Escherichia coli]|uniref:hypothetical protein n=1 Tax=Escherichia coli TaxID=562 RepID=UPI0028A0D99D
PLIPALIIAKRAPTEDWLLFFVVYEITSTFNELIRLSISLLNIKPQASSNIKTPLNPLNKKTF